jgi:hypothetical protein
MHTWITRALEILFYALPIAIMLDLRVALMLWLVLAVLRFAAIQRTVQAIQLHSTGSRIGRIARAVDRYAEDRYAEQRKK